MALIVIALWTLAGVITVLAILSLAQGAAQHRALKARFPS